MNVLPVDLCNSTMGRLASNLNTPISPKSRLHSGSSTEQDNSKTGDVPDSRAALDQVCMYWFSDEGLFGYLLQLRKHVE